MARRGHRCPSRPTSHPDPDRKSTRLNSSHGYISYAVFCLEKKNPRSLDLVDDLARIDRAMDDRGRGRRDPGRGREVQRADALERAAGDAETPAADADGDVG